MVFRSSIAWLSDSLSTLRGAGYPYPTQDSLPAVGQTLLDGISTRRVVTKGFKAVSLHLILPSQTYLAQSEEPRHNRFLRRRQLPDIFHPIEGGSMATASRFKQSADGGWGRFFIGPFLALTP